MSSQIFISCGFPGASSAVQSIEVFAYWILINLILKRIFIEHCFCSRLFNIWTSNRSIGYCWSLPGPDGLRAVHPHKTWYAGEILQFTHTHHYTEQWRALLVKPLFWSFSNCCSGKKNDLTTLKMTIIDFLHLIWIQTFSCCIDWELPLIWKL